MRVHPHPLPHPSFLEGDGFGGKQCKHPSSTGRGSRRGGKGRRGSAWLCVYEDDTWTALPARACSVGVFLRLNEKKFSEIYAAVAAGEKGGWGIEVESSPLFPRCRAMGGEPAERSSLGGGGGGDPFVSIIHANGRRWRRRTYNTLRLAPPTAGPFEEERERGRGSICGTNNNTSFP